MVSSKLQPVDVQEWIAKHSKFFIPPICNKLLYTKQLKVFFVGGPNQRKDYHIELGEEFFYQLRGTMHLEVIEHGRPRTVVIREGECFLLPARIPHSPQRFADTMGLVIERERAPYELDGLRYYTESAFTEMAESTELTVQSTTRPEQHTATEAGQKNDGILYERWFHCTDLGTQLAPIIAQFKQYRTGIPSSVSRLRAAPYEDDRERSLCEPVNIAEWLQRHADEIELHGRKAFCDELRFTTLVHVYGGRAQRKHSIFAEFSQEIFLLQLTESSEAEVRDWASDVKPNGNGQCDNAPGTLQLRAGQCFLLNPQHRMTLQTNSGGLWRPGEPRERSIQAFEQLSRRNSTERPSNTSSWLQAYKQLQ